LREEFSDLKDVPGLELAWRSPGAKAVGLFRQLTEEPGLPAASFGVDERSGSELLVYYGETSGPIFQLLNTTIRSVLEKLEVERREEMLLDELGSNWESLEAIYEISADVLRYGDVKEALERLIDRFTGLQDDLRAALFLTRSGRLQPIAGLQFTGQKTGAFEWKDLGPLEEPIRAGRAIVINERAAQPETAGNVPWLGFPRVAAAPVTSRQKVIGLLAVWREDTRFEFGAPFSRLMEAITYQASMLLESDRLKRTMRENERWAQEIEIASSIQQTLLFGKAPVNLPGFDIAAYSAASQRIDGDFHDFLKHSDHSVDILIGDVMGKGIAAALLGAATKNQFLRAIANLAIRSTSGPPSPAAIVKRAAGRMGDQLIALERFVTLCYARFDLGRNCVDYVDCGHTGLLLHRKQTGEARFLRSEDLPIGVLADFDCTQHSIRMEPGDTYLLFSDGVTETRSPEEDFFGEDRLVECVENWSSLGTRTLLEQIRKSAAEFSRHQAQTDDFTCIALTVRLDTSVPPVARRSEDFFCGLDELQRMRDWVAEAASQVPDGGIGEVSLQKLELACTEIFVNCVQHGTASASNGPDSETGRDFCPEPVRMTALAFPTHVRVELRHDGVPFDPLSIPQPSFDGSRDGGFGTYIVFHCADEAAYQRSGETNLVSISIMRRNRP
jgi:sigma-B regulation protein RsbU (phosphoserine phosphatase)